jgi:hypothetical protein
MRLGVFVVVVLWFSDVAFGQHFSYGVVAGTALSDDFSSHYFPSVAGFSTLQRPGGKGVIVGPMLEWNFSPHTSVEINGLFRELRFEDLHAGAHNPTVTWELPFLAKYRLSTGSSPLRPFVEAGPSFRTTGNLNANPSHVGISAGAGFVAIGLRQINIESTLRYTRRTPDSRPFGIQSRPDQLELLFKFSHTAISDTRPFGTRFSVGAVLGTNLLGDYNTTSSTARDVLSGTQITFLSRSGPRSFLIGPTFELQASEHFSLELDALYRPVREHNTTTTVFSGQTFSQSGAGSFATWQLPVMLKYDLRLPLLGDQLTPFVEAGPTFRISGSVTHFGFTIGGGVSTHVGRLKIAPAVRYSRWQSDPFGRVKSDEANVLVGFTF